MTLLLAAPAAGASPPRDVVVGEPGATAGRISASASSARFPIGEPEGPTIAVSVTEACQVVCTAADPQAIASFVGTLIHGPEIELLTVQLDAPFQIDHDCGYGAEACYYTHEDKIVISGDDTPGHEGVSREFVLAHEYGHHVANHRQSPAPFPAAVNWGTPRWSSHERICQARRRGVLFPGDEGLHYGQNPGEAFAEAFARYHIPNSGTRWAWAPFLRPESVAFRAIREDTLNPWRGRNSFQLAGKAVADRRGVVKSFRTPLDGTVSLRPSRALRRGYRLRLISSSGQVLRTSRHSFGPRRKLNFTVCGQSRLRVRLERTRRSNPPFQLMIQRP